MNYPSLKTRARIAVPQILWWSAVLLLLIGCASPAQRLETRAGALGLSAGWVKGTDYRHRVYRKPGRGVPGRLHVYLEGDGSPWLNRFVVAPDPTPRRPVALELMALDPAPALYLGRPCYHGRAGIPPCRSHDWTFGRFSERVVDSLAAVLVRERDAGQGRELVLIGHSGGGVLAWLLAERVPGVVGLITVAAPLDVAAWTARHDYTPLWDSLDPGQRVPLPESMVQLHLAGAEDGNVPPGLMRTMLADRGLADMPVVFPGQDHNCCWRAVWPQVLAVFQSLSVSDAADKSR